MAANHASNIATMTSNSTASNNTTDAKETPRIGTVQQPLSSLHAFPPELRELIYEFAVVSPDYIPSRVDVRDVIKVTAGTSRIAEGEEKNSSTTTSTRTTSGKTSTKLHQQHQILPSQPPLSRTDRSTRAEVLRVFYKRNTFLFRATPLVPNPLRASLTSTGLLLDSSSGSSSSAGREKGKEEYAMGAARYISRIAIERSVRKSCATVQHVEDLSSSSSGALALGGRRA